MISNSQQMSHGFSRYKGELKPDLESVQSNDTEFGSGGLMGFYKRVILPRLCDIAMRSKRLTPYRARVIGAAEGRVLEVGAGSGLNFALYRPAAREILALEPDPALLAMAERNAGRAMRPIQFLEASAQQIPLSDKSVDTVVTTWTLCTIPDAAEAVREMRRVLRPSGHLLFVEHGLAPEAYVQTWQNRLTPIWQCVSGGCHLNRPILDIIGKGGFKVDGFKAGYMPGPRIMTFIYEGIGRPS
jgi:SAM-dependent methyltransferase